MADPRLLKPTAITIALCGLLLHAPSPLAQSPVRAGHGASSSEKVELQKDIQPIFEKNCFSCHGTTTQMNGLRLDSKEAAFAGGKSGKAIMPGDASKSTLYQRVAGIGELARMPFGGKPPEAAQIALIRTWIDQGAEWPDGYAVKPAETEKHWAFIPPPPAPLPQSMHNTWPKNPLDVL